MSDPYADEYTLTGWASDDNRVMVEPIEDAGLRLTGWDADDRAIVITINEMQRDDLRRWLNRTHAKRRA